MTQKLLGIFPKEALKPLDILYNTLKQDTIVKSGYGVYTYIHAFVDMLRCEPLCHFAKSQLLQPTLRSDLIYE